MAPVPDWRCSECGAHAEPFLPFIDERYPLGRCLAPDEPVPPGKRPRRGHGHVLIVPSAAEAWELIRARRARAATARHWSHTPERPAPLCTLCFEAFRHRAHVKDRRLEPGCGLCDEARTRTAPARAGRPPA